MKKVLVMAVALICVCAFADSHAKPCCPAGAAEKVQGKICIGLTSAQVLQILGSPTVETVDKNGLGVWVYDNICAMSYSGKGRVWSFTRQAGTEGALTIVVKFDADKRLRDLCAHSHRVKEMGDEER